MNIEECLDLYIGKDIQKLRKIADNVYIYINHIGGDMLSYYRFIKGGDKKV